MDSSTFYDPDSGDGGLQLGVYVHHARGIHASRQQDVYAKLSLTCSPDESVSTRLASAAAGSADPGFDEPLSVGRVASPMSAVLKCEIWMLSRSPLLLDDDQLLGFALVPLSSVAAAPARTLTHDFPLSSTDLLPSPAGTVRLTLSLRNSPAAPTPNPTPTPTRAVSTSSSAGITSEVVILDPADFRRLDPPDVAAVAEENRRMVADYFDIMARPPSSDHDMMSNSTDDNPSSSTATSLGADGSKKIAADSSPSPSPSSNSSSSAAEVGTPTSKLENDSRDRGGGVSVFESPMGGINLEAEQAAMQQQQIVEMYMKSMRQFSESLAKMKLPMDLDNVPLPDDRGAVIQTQSNNMSDAEQEAKKNKKKDGSRVFYGSRAFF